MRATDRGPLGPPERMVAWMDDREGKFERSGWHDVLTQVPDHALARRKKQRTPAASAIAGRGWYHARWIALIVVLIAANGYVVSSYLAAKAGQSDWSWEKMFAASHTVTALQRHEQAGFTIGPPQAGRLVPPSAEAARIANTPRSTPVPQPVRKATVTYRPDAAAAIGLKCVAGVAYRVETRAGIVSYTNDPAIRCFDG